MARKTRGVDFFQLRRIDMGIDLSRRDVRMAEHGLDGSQIRPPLQQVCGEGVAKHMRRG